MQFPQIGTRLTTAINVVAGDHNSLKFVIPTHHANHRVQTRIRVTPSGGAGNDLIYTLWVPEQLSAGIDPDQLLAYGQPMAPPSIGIEERSFQPLPELDGPTEWRFYWFYPSGANVTLSFQIMYEAIDMGGVV